MKISYFKRSLRGARRAGFSMIEIMVVVGIMATLLVMGAPTLSAVFGSSKLGQGSQDLSNFLHIAHQTALKENRPVEVRFYKFEDPDTAQRDDLYQAYRMFVLRPPPATQATSKFDVVAEPEGPIKRMPGGTYIAENQALSSLISGNVINGTEEGVRGLVSGKRITAPYRAFVFRPDGSLNLSSNSKWFFTVLPKETYFKDKELTPDNYVCLSINPNNGEVRTYAP